jgi:hypothetical protein
MKKAVLLFLLILVSISCRGETFFVLVSEIRDGKELGRPSASQEGVIEAMFDLGFISFDSGPYRPAVNWTTMDFREPLAIARQGLAQFILAAEVRSVTERLPPLRGLQRCRPGGRGDGDGQLRRANSIPVLLRVPPFGRPRNRRPVHRAAQDQPVSSGSSFLFFLLNCSVRQEIQPM